MKKRPIPAVFSFSCELVNFVNVDRGCGIRVRMRAWLIHTLFQCSQVHRVPKSGFNMRQNSVNVEEHRNPATFTSSQSVTTKFLCLSGFYRFFTFRLYSHEPPRARLDSLSSYCACVRFVIRSTVTAADRTCEFRTGFSLTGHFWQVPHPTACTHFL